MQSVKVTGALSSELVCSTDVDVGWKVIDLKDAIEQIASVPKCEQRLLFNGQVVEDTEALTEALLENLLSVQLVRLDVRRDQALEQVKRGWSLLAIEERYRADREIVLAAVGKSSGQLGFASKDLRADYEVALVALQKDASASRFVDKELLSDGHFLEKAFARPSDRMRFASEELLLNREYVLAQVSREGSALKFAGKDMWHDHDVLAAAQRHGPVLGFAPDELRQDEAFVLQVVQGHPDELGLAPECFRSNQQVVLAAVQNNPHMLQHASLTLRGDITVVLIAVRSDGLSLRFASDALKDEFEVALVAVSQKGSALQFASDRLKGNFEIVRQAVQTDVKSLRFASKSLKRGCEAMISMCQMNPESLRFASIELRLDKKFVDSVCQLHPHIFGNSALAWIMPDDARNLHKMQKAVFIDARRPEEHAKSCIPGALSLPWGHSWPPEILSVIDRPDLVVVVYSDSGSGISRCKGLANALQDRQPLQVHRVVRLVGGLNEWKRNALPVDGDGRQVVGFQGNQFEIGE